MKTTTVMASELGDDWTPAAHMPRLMTQAQQLREGDKVRIRDHRSTTDAERRWHLVTVLGVEKGRGEMIIMTNKWPIAYVCALDELVELVEITRTATMRCIICHRADHQDTDRVTVTLDDYLDADLLKRGGLHVAIIDLEIRNLTGYCKDHGTDLLT